MIKEGRTSSNKLNYVTELGNIIDGMKSDIEKKGTVNWDEITKDNSKALLRFISKSPKQKQQTTFQINQN